ncbi:hypothetical protein COS91_01320 [Candidatus Desantisbacteria bacterium CG07_land_8_20_14_0_80_39_15]|uniref:dihydrouracil dehydrogenase (NAD(+)) n=2 Tax=unclassified Candidatus Desantisiibacteriota TaxID=3106372 RepID=A0A2H9PE75_9BACT|nr:MAG: hypothetical protein COS91_01320 [Candidatus Desantisbacteria bacterium CG07_land_8_20_14_0_80_39_15]PIZ17275.1 MAG: hypothetical protein COY51_00615 [Candidatus Desantisbacteria bacterium CG_4_10_14_0_8_um_filter_39_17]
MFIPVKVAGYEFRNPFVVGSGPTAKSITQLKEAEEQGWGGVSIKLTMDPDPYINLPPRYRWYKNLDYHIFTAETRLTFSEGLKLMDDARKETKEMILFGNFAYFGDEGLKGWVNMAKKFEEAGAHILEINFCCPNMSFTKEASGESSGPRSGASLGQDPELVGMIVKAMVESVQIPVFAKITPEGGNIGDVAKRAVENGASGISSVGNRLGMPPFDIYHPQKTTYNLQEGFSLGCLSGPWLKTEAEKDVFQIRKAIGTSPAVVGLGGIKTFQDVIEYAMVGADLFGICTETMVSGFGIVKKIGEGVQKYINEMGFSSFSEIRDKMLPYLKTSADIKTLPGYAIVDENLCNGCERCSKIGHCCAIEIKNKKAFVNKEKCLACSTCTDICPKSAIKMVTGKM